MSVFDKLGQYGKTLEAVTSTVKWVEHQAQSAPEKLTSAQKLEMAVTILAAFYPQPTNLVPLINACVAVFNLIGVFKKSK